MFWGIFCPGGQEGGGVEFDFVVFLEVKKSDHAYL